MCSCDGIWNGTFGRKLLNLKWHKQFEGDADFDDFESADHFGPAVLEGALLSEDKGDRPGRLHTAAENLAGV